MNRFKRYTTILNLFIVAALFGLTACSNDLDFKTTFTSPKVLDKGDPVMFLKNEVGKISKVSQQEGKTEVNFSINKDKILQYNLNSNIAVSAVASKPALELHIQKEGGELLAGQDVKALNNPLEVAAWSAGGAMDSLNDLLSSTTGAIGSFLNSQDFDNVEQQLGDLLSNLSKNSTESVNQLNEGLAEIFKNFNKNSSETLKQADQLNEALNKGIEDLQKQGETALSDILSQLQKSLEESGLGEPNGTENPASNEAMPQGEVF